MTGLGPYFEHYLTLERVHPTRTYDYVTRGFRNEPVIDVTIRGPKCRAGESWLYVAVPAGAALASLSQGQKLYVGAQTKDRMFRGDGGIGGTNYHHGQMRAGNGEDRPVAYLRAGRRIDIHRIGAPALQRAVSEVAALKPLGRLLEQPRTPKRHLGWWFEQFILHIQAGQWRWNTAPAERSHAPLFEEIWDELRPTGDCFEAAARFVTQASVLMYPEDYRLVHGKVAGLRQDVLVNHAWVEEGDLVHERSAGRTAVYPKHRYYAEQGVTYTRKYTPEEALVLGARHGHWGPWDAAHLPDRRT